MEGTDLWDFLLWPPQRHSCNLSKAAIQDMVKGEYVLNPLLGEWVQ